MIEGALGLLALAYSALILFTLAAALKKLFAPRKAALYAFGLSAMIHGATTPAMGEHAWAALAFWGIPHLLLLPVLLFAARRQTTGS